MKLKGKSLNQAFEGTARSPVESESVRHFSIFLARCTDLTAVPQLNVIFQNKEQKLSVREDFKSVEGLISRLLNIGEEFRNNDSYWAHLKNKEDFSQIYNIPHPQKHKIEILYSKGRDMGLYMGDALSSISFNFRRYPTLTSVIDGFQSSWVYEDDLPEISKNAEKACSDSEISPWAVQQMVTLFHEQIKLLKAVGITLNMLKQSDLYKFENGIDIMKEKQQGINISNIKDSNVIVDSDNAMASITISNSKELFEKLLMAIENSKIDPQKKSEIVAATKNLQVAEGSDSFGEKYKDFMQTAANHMALLAPFIPHLSALL